MDLGKKLLKQKRSSRHTLYDRAPSQDPDSDGDYTDLPDDLLPELEIRQVTAIDQEAEEPVLAKQQQQLIREVQPALKPVQQLSLDDEITVCIAQEKKSEQPGHARQQSQLHEEDSDEQEIILSPPIRRIASFEQASYPSHSLVERADWSAEKKSLLNEDADLDELLPLTDVTSLLLQDQPARSAPLSDSVSLGRSVEGKGKSYISTAPNNEPSILPFCFPSIFTKAQKITEMEEYPRSLYPVSWKQLSDLLDDKDEKKIEEFGGLEGLARSLKTNLKDGLPNDDDVISRTKCFGPNSVPEPPPKSFFEMFIEGLDDTTIKILIVAGFLSLFLELVLAKNSEERKKGWIEGTAILVAVLVVGLVTAWNNYSKELQFRSLNSVKNNRIIKVMRAGVQQQVSIYNVMVGDIVCLDTGDHIPADGIFIQGHGLEVDESNMTGESESVKKSLEAPFLMSGCLVTQGIATMLVTGVGLHTQWGKILSMLNVEQEDTPLQQKLGDLAEQIGKIGTGFATVTFLVLFIRWMAKVTDSFEFSDLSLLLDYFVIAITIVVVAVPEGLPLAVTISLAYSMKQMHDENNLVRYLEACETMGGVTTICSDKTGTLTENRMTVVQMWYSGEYKQYIPKREDMSTQFVKLYSSAVSINSNANINSLANGKMWKMDYRRVREAVNISQLYPFSSDRKRMSVLLSPDNGVKRLYTKGASEIVLGLCTTYISETGQVLQLTPEVRKSITQVIEKMAQQALRTLCIAYRDISDPDVITSEPPEAELTLIAVTGIQDPLRAEVPYAVEQCKGAGIFVRMVTGDNITTAKAIASSCGILTDGIAMEGPDFRKLSIDEMDEVLPKLQVLARSTPSDKHRLVKRLRELGEVVGVTGDGTNDAPALKEADIGLSMGISGTEVAKEASDMIIMDDNFSTIVNAVSWGRSVFDNIRKFLQFQLTVNVVALVLAFIGGAMGQRPLTSVQLLWVNLLMDSWGALALGTERPTPDLLQRKPYGRFESLISATMYRNILGQALFQMLVLFFILFAGCDALYDGNECMCGSGHSDAFILECEASGTPLTDATDPNVFKGLLTNYMFAGVIVASAVIQAFIIMYGGALTQTVPLGARDWFISLILGSSMLVTGYVLRFVPLDRHIARLMGARHQ